MMLSVDLQALFNGYTYPMPCAYFLKGGFAFIPCAYHFGIDSFF